MKRIIKNSSIRCFYALWILIGSSVCVHAQREATENDSAKRSNALRSISISNVPLKIRYDLKYGDEDQSLQRADVYRPDTKDRLPAVLMIHGGAWIAGDKSHDSTHAKKIASEGYVVVAINYRLAPKHRFPAQLEDCNRALSWLVENQEVYGVDTNRIATWGYSAGGHLSALMATNPLDGLPRLRACVAGGAPCDLTMIPEDSKLLKGFLGATRAEAPQKYVEASPVSHVTRDDPPTFLFHGTGDRLVPPDSSERMLAALTACDVESERYLIDKKAHIMAFLDADALDKSIAFLDKHLKPLSKKETKSDE